VLSLFGAFPLLLSTDLQISVTDALFESMSGLTTTGATVLTGLDALPASILYYRQQLQWLGGMGIIVLAVAVMPMLGVGGMQLYRAETPGPMKDNKLTPRITETAKALWYIYLGLTVSCALAYWAVGMTFFDAVAHAFSTVAIGGFSTHDASLGFFDSPAIALIAICFMLISAVNFALHFTVVRGRSPGAYLRDPEVRAFAGFVSVVILITVTIYICNCSVSRYVHPVGKHFTFPLVIFQPVCPDLICCPVTNQNFIAFVTKHVNNLYICDTYFVRVRFDRFANQLFPAEQIHDVIRNREFRVYSNG